jgi:hypothetical protein
MTTFNQLSDGEIKRLAEILATEHPSATKEQTTELILDWLDDIGGLETLSVTDRVDLVERILNLLHFHQKDNSCSKKRIS